MGQSWSLWQNGKAAAFAMLTLCAVVAASGTGHAAPALQASPSPDAAPSLVAQAAPSAPDGRIEVAQGFFQRLFGIGSNKKKKSSGKASKGKAGTKKSKPRVTPPPVKTVTKDPDAAVIAVFGDEFSQDIAFGLRDAFAKTPDVRVDIHSLRNTGLLHRASKNPLADFEALVEKKPFTFAVVMVGLNDRGTFPAVKDEEGEIVTEAIKFQEPGWQEAYRKRVDSVRANLLNQDKPLYWVGLPPVKSPKLSNQLSYLNDIIRARLVEREERFIDIWDAFSNEDGDYVRRGPDLSGQAKNLRHKSGIRFTAAGRRKLAFFVEKLVIRALSQSVDETVLPDFLSQADETALKEGRGDSRGIFVVRQPPLDANQLIKPKSSSSNRLAGGLRSSEPVVTAPDLRVDHFEWTNSAEN
ncbi:MAG: hypothetical protein N4A65_11415 [Cohaesibacter sp.]|jgi:hypothetical protein|nr:hypothetical protein [Cohaesibacter sp.]